MLEIETGGTVLNPVAAVLDGSVLHQRILQRFDSAPNACGRGTVTH
jgi:hypothetical protein